MDGAEFVRGVMERLGVESAADLAEAMRWKRGTERTVSRWLAGETRPSFDYVMEMTDRAGLLSTSAELRPVAVAMHPEDRLEEVSVRLDEVWKNQGSALRDLATVNGTLQDFASTLREIRAMCARLLEDEQDVPNRSRRR